MSGAESCAVSAVVLTRNEAENLPRCLASLGWCKERVVLDSGSTDETVRVSLENGARVLEHKPEGKFLISEQRNWALDNGGLKGEWVLFLDADEEVPQDLAERLAAISRQGDGAMDAYELTPRYWFLGRWLRRTQGYPNWHARFLRLGRARFEGGVWECFDAGARVGRVEVPYEHYAFSKGMSDWIERHDRYSSWTAQNTVDFLKSGNSGELKTRRKLRLRLVAARLWPLAPAGRFLQMYLWRLGFLEGWQSLVFCLMVAFYELMVVVKIIELLRKKKGLKL